MIGELIKEAKKTGNVIIIDKIIKYYEPYFVNNIIKIYGDDYVDRAKEMLPNLVIYYLSNDLKSSLYRFLLDRSENLFPKESNSYDKKISNGQVDEVRNHYINKLYNVLLEICNTKILTKEELYKLSVYDINYTFNNYTNGEKKSSCSKYFGQMIFRKVKYYKDEEFLLLSYAGKIEMKKEIKVYFYNKYMYLLDSFNNISLDDYKKIIDNIIEFTAKHKNFIFSVSENRIISELENHSKKTKLEHKKSFEIEISKLKNKESFDYDFLKSSCLYIKEFIFKRYKDKVSISPDELKKQIDIMYERYFDAALKYISNSNGKTLTQYIHTRICSRLVNNKKIFNDYFYIDDERRKNIDDNFYLVSCYARKYAGSCPREVLEKKLEERYYDVAANYYKKTRKVTFYMYVSGKLRDEVKSAIKNYEGDQLNLDDEDEKNDIEKNVYLINRYAVKYAGSCPREVLEKKLEVKYYDVVDTYYRKKRKIALEDYLKNTLCAEAKNIVSNYVDDSILMDQVKK